MRLRLYYCDSIPNESKTSHVVICQYAQCINKTDVIILCLCAGVSTQDFMF